MSIGPKLPENDPKPGKIEKITLSTKKAVFGIFNRPTHYVFYLTLVGIVIKLFLEQPIAWQLWIIVIFLGLVKIFQHISETVNNQKK